MLDGAANPLETAIRSIVRSEITALAGIVEAEPEMISPEQAAKICNGCSKQVILDLHHDRLSNGFPSVQLSSKIILIDKRRLKAWFASGGLGVKE